MNFSLKSLLVSLILLFLLLFLSFCFCRFCFRHFTFVVWGIVVFVLGIVANVGNVLLRNLPFREHVVPTVQFAGGSAAASPYHSVLTHCIIWVMSMLSASERSTGKFATSSSLMSSQSRGCMRNVPGPRNIFVCVAVHSSCDSWKHVIAYGIHWISPAFSNVLRSRYGVGFSPVPNESNVTSSIDSLSPVVPQASGRPHTLGLFANTPPSM